MYKLLESDNIIDFIRDESLNTEIGIHVKNDIVLPLTKKEYENIKICFDYPKTIDFDVKNDQEIGSIKIYNENNLIFIEKIYTIL